MSTNGTKKNDRTIVLFDVDGTLTKPRNPIKPEMDSLLRTLRSKFDVGLVGGSDLKKIVEQMTLEGEQKVNTSAVLSNFDFVFAENGLVAYKNQEQIGNQSITKFLGEEKLQDVINFALQYMSQLRLPCKRGNFIEFRTGMLNICPVGRSCSQEERDVFAKFDEENNIRQKFAEALRSEFGQKYGITFAIGGQISIDAYPHGWDKTYCLQFLKGCYDKIYFFGDRTAPGGNDHEIFSDERTIGVTVINPDDTLRKVQESLLI